MFRIPTPSKLLHGLPPLPHVPSWSLPRYGPFPGASSHGINLGLLNLAHAFSPQGLYQGFGPHGAGGELAAPFIGSAQRIQQGKPPTLAQMALMASFIPGKAGFKGMANETGKGLIGPYSQAIPVRPGIRPRPAAPLTAQQLLTLHAIAQKHGRLFS